MEREDKREKKRKRINKDQNKGKSRIPKMETMAGKRDAEHKALTTDKQETRQSRIHATKEAVVEWRNKGSL